MKSISLLLLALIVVPAWAEEIAVVPSASQPSMQATQIAPSIKTDSGWLNFLIKDATASTLTCPTGCQLAHCPAPTGPVVCCKNNMPC